MEQASAEADLARPDALECNGARRPDLDPLRDQGLGLAVLVGMSTALVMSQSKLVERSIYDPGGCGRCESPFGIA